MASLSFRLVFLCYMLQSTISVPIIPSKVNVDLPMTSFSSSVKPIDPSLLATLKESKARSIGKLSPVTLPEVTQIESNTDEEISTDNVQRNFESLANILPNITPLACKKDFMKLSKDYYNAVHDTSNIAKINSLASKRLRSNLLHMTKNISPQLVSIINQGIAPKTVTEIESLSATESDLEVPLNVLPSLTSLPLVNEELLCENNLISNNIKRSAESLMPWILRPKVDLQKTILEPLESTKSFIVPQFTNPVLDRITQNNNNIQQIIQNSDSIVKVPNNAYGNIFAEQQQSGRLLVADINPILIKPDQFINNIPICANAIENKSTLADLLKMNDCSNIPINNSNEFITLPELIKYNALNNANNFDLTAYEIPKYPVNYNNAYSTAIVSPNSFNVCPYLSPILQPDLSSLDAIKVPIASSIATLLNLDKLSTIPDIPLYVENEVIYPIPQLPIVNINPYQPPINIDLMTAAVFNTNPGFGQLTNPTSPYIFPIENCNNLVPIITLPEVSFYKNNVYDTDISYSPQRIIDLNNPIDSCNKLNIINRQNIPNNNYSPIVLPEVVFDKPLSNISPLAPIINIPIDPSNCILGNYLDSNDILYALPQSLPEVSLLNNPYTAVASNNILKNIIDPINPHPYLIMNTPSDNFNLINDISKANINSILNIDSSTALPKVTICPSIMENNLIPASPIIPKPPVFYNANLPNNYFNYNDLDALSYLGITSLPGVSCPLISKDFISSSLIGEALSILPIGPTRSDLNYIDLTQMTPINSLLTDITSSITKSIISPGNSPLPNPQLPSYFQLPSVNLYNSPNQANIYQQIPNYNTLPPFLPNSLSSASLNSINSPIIYDIDISTPLRTFDVIDINPKKVLPSIFTPFDILDSDPYFPVSKPLDLSQIVDLPIPPSFGSQDIIPLEIIF